MYWPSYCSDALHGPLQLTTALPKRKHNVAPHSVLGRHVIDKVPARAPTSSDASVAHNTGKTPDSPFEIAVGGVITRLGLQVVPQVGVAGYFIDLGVLKPGSTGDFLLGIECDGAAYHSAKSARDRDRLREEVIRKRGWELHRIWSTDWFLNQKHEEDRLVQAIRQAMAS